MSEPVATANLMILSALLGFSIRALLQPFFSESASSIESPRSLFGAIGIIGDAARLPGPQAPEPGTSGNFAFKALRADESSAEGSRKDRESAERSMKALESISREEASEAVGMSVHDTSSSVVAGRQLFPKPEELWNAAWRGLEPPSAVVRQSSSLSSLSFKDRLLGRSTSSIQRCAFPLSLHILAMHLHGICWHQAHSDVLTSLTEMI